MTALAKSASSRSNAGSPQPAGTPRAAKPTTPPSESPFLRASSIAVTIAGRSCFIRAPGGRRLDIGKGHVNRDQPTASMMCTLLDPGEDVDVELLRKESTGECPGRNPAHCFSGRASPSAAMVPDAVFGLVGPVGVAGPIHILQVVICARVLVLVADHHCQGNAGGQAVEDTRENLYLVALGPLGGQSALTRSTAIQVRLDFLEREGHSRRTSVTTTPTAGPWDSPNVLTEKGSRTCCSL